jgi:hypothetical protein
MKFAVTAGGPGLLREGFIFRAEVQEEEKQELTCQFVIVSYEKKMCALF